MLKRSQLYDNLGTMLETGVSLSEAIVVCVAEDTSPTSQSLRALGELISHSSSDFSSDSNDEELLERVRPKFPTIDRALLGCGLRSGRLPEVLRQLSAWYQQMEDLSQKMRRGLAYPLFLAHVAIFGTSAPAITSGATAFFGSLLWKLALLYLPLFVLVTLWKRRNPFVWGFAQRLPFIGSVMRSFALSRFCKVFHAMQASGASILDSTVLAIEACDHPELRPALKQGLDIAYKGAPLSEGFGEALPLEFRTSWRVAEESGQLEEVSERLAKRHAEVAGRDMETATGFYTKTALVVAILVTAAVALSMALKVYAPLLDG